MEQALPPFNQQISSFCLLKQIDGHENLVNELNRQVFLSSTPGSQIPDRPELTSLLRLQYGGMADNWDVTSCRGGVLIKAPSWISINGLIFDFAYWEEGWGLQMSPWQFIDRAQHLPAMTRVQCTIWNFPIEYWHPLYFQQMVTSMGSIAGYAQRHTRGKDKS